MANKHSAFRQPGRYWVIYDGGQSIARWAFNGRAWYWFTEGSSFGKNDEDMTHIYPDRIPEPGERSKVKLSEVVGCSLDGEPTVKGANTVILLHLRIHTDGLPHPEHAREAAVKAINDYYDRGGLAL